MLQTKGKTVYSQDQGTGLWVKIIVTYLPHTGTYKRRTMPTTDFEKRFGYTKLQATEWGVFT